MQARAGAGDGFDIGDAERGFQDRMDQDRLFDPVARFELGQQLVEIMDIPRPLDLGQHHHVELVPRRRDDLGDVIEEPGRIEAIDPHPEPGIAEIIRRRSLDEAFARRLLGVDRNGILEIAEQHIHPPDHLGQTTAQFFVMRREKMDHPFQRHRQIAIGCGRPDGQRFVELAGRLHGHGGRISQ